MTQAQLADGTILDFPDETSPDVIQRVVKQHIAAQQQQAAPQQPDAVQQDLNDRTSGAAGGALSGLSGYFNSIPIVGPAILGGEQKLAAYLATKIKGGNYEDNLAQLQGLTKAADKQHPIAKTVGDVGGAVVPMVALGTTSLGARALGLESMGAQAGMTAAQRAALPLAARAGDFAARAGMSGLSSTAIGAADTAARGGNPDDVVSSGLISGGIGLAVPVVGGALHAGLNALGDEVAPLWRSLTNYAAEADRRVGTALAADAAANPGGMFTPQQEQLAAQSGINLMNVDRGGETTLALARSVANQSPVARQAITNAASDRFEGQSPRAVQFIRNLFGGNVDDLAVQDQLQQAARQANGGAYAAAHANPNANAIYTPRIQELMQSNAFRNAVNDVTRTSSDVGAIRGQQAIANPFETLPNGNLVPRAGVSPNLEFWDHVQRNLRSQAEGLRINNPTEAATIRNLRNSLNGELDRVVPEFQAARQGAAGFFGANDALEAGRNFANTPRQIPEATRAVAQMNPAERQLFAHGYASELIDKLGVPGDRSNVIQRMFGNPAARAQNEVALGPHRAADIESYARVEQLADRLRGALGNSTTARQLAEMGIGAGVGGAYSGDWKGAGIGALTMFAGRRAVNAANAQVYNRMAQLLTSNNPQLLNSARQMAARTPAYMTALRNISDAIGAPSRAGGVLAGRANNQ